MPSRDLRPRGELHETLSRLAITRADYAGLLAAARAAVAAADAGEPDPLHFVRDLLAERGQLPEPGAVPLVVLADARSALALTGPAAGRPLRPDPDTRLAPSVNPPRSGEPSPPLAAPCGCLYDVAAGSYGGSGPFTLAVSCGRHEGQPPARGLYRVSLPGFTDVPCPGCIGRGTGTQCCMCGGPVPEALRRAPGDPSEIRQDCPGCRAARVHDHATAVVS